jgi:transposase
MAHKYRLYPKPQQIQMLNEHCGQTRAIYNACVAQAEFWHRGWRGARTPSHNERAKQLVELRHCDQFSWLGEGSSSVQQSALRDFDSAMQKFFKGITGFPNFKKRGQKESFTIRDVSVKIYNRTQAAIYVPKLGFVRFRLHRALPEEYGMARVTRDRCGAWFVSFTAPQPIFEKAPTGKRGGGDLGVKTTLHLSDGRMFRAPKMSSKDEAKLHDLQRQLARQVKGSNRRAQTKLKIARINRKEANRRKDWIEKVSTRLVREYDFFAFENLNVAGMLRSPAVKPDPENEGQFLPNGAAAKAGLNRAISAQSWSQLVIRTQQKAAAATSETLIVKVDPRHTSQTCPQCNHVSAENRESQAVFSCVSCGYSANADLVGAINIHTRGEELASAMLPSSA